MSAKPYREGKGWAARVRKAGINEYKSGFRTKDDARRWAMALELGVAWTDPNPAAMAPTLAAVPATACAPAVAGLRAAGLTEDVSLAAAMKAHCKKRTGKQ